MATITRSHKIRLNPTPDQEAYFRRAAGTKRFIYNWGLVEWQRQYAVHKAGQQDKPPTALSLKKDFNAIKEQEYPWVYAVTKCVVEGAFDDLGKAYANFRAGRTKYPKFKKKGKSRDSFYLANDKFSLGDHRVQVPVLGDFLVKQKEANGETVAHKQQAKKELGWVNMAENLRYVTEHTPAPNEKPRHTRKLVIRQTVKILGATIGRHGTHWYLSIQVEIEQEYAPVAGPPVGIDVGVARLATLSDGKQFENQKPLTRLLQQVRHLNKELARRTKGSANWQKTKRKLARLHQRIASMRNDSHHKIAFTVSERYSFIGVEDLNVTGMVKNRKLSRALSDAGLGQLLRYISTKAGRHGTPVIKVDRFFPSTKRCHQCHHERDMSLSERTYVCLNPACGWSGDRDENAAKNILQEAVRMAGRVA